MAPASAGDAVSGVTPSTAAAPASNSAQNAAAAVPAPPPAPPARISDTAGRATSAPEAKPGTPDGEVWKSGELSARPNATELRVTFQTEGLGPVELRAALRQNSVAASIAVARGDVQAALSGDLPAVRQALAQHNLQLESLRVIHGSMGSQADLSAGSHSPRENRGRTPAMAAARVTASAPAGESTQAAVGLPESSGGVLPGKVSVRV
jgi:flagellar hook-length control protein FliK